MATKKSKTSKRSKKRSTVKDLTPKRASSVKGGAIWNDTVAGDLKSTVKF